MLQAGRFGRWQLPPDWLRIEGDQVRIADHFKPLFSYDAIRVPLYLAWDERNDATLTQPFTQFWDYFRGAPFTPPWTNLTNDSVDSYDAPPGFYTVMQLVYSQAGRSPPNRRTPPAEDEHYYSASLRLLGQLARSDTAH